MTKEKIKGKLIEIFSSIQGEGGSVSGSAFGQPQVFVRFAGCNIASQDFGTSGCLWCDTTSAKSIKANGRAITLTAQETFDLIVLSKPESSLHSVSLTGGEPLVQVDFLKDLLTLLKQNNYTTFLETNASLPSALEKVVSLLDYASVDIKDRSAKAAKNWTRLVDLEIKSLEILEKHNVKTYAKIVITNTTEALDLIRLRDKISHLNIPVVLQPVSPYQGIFPPDINRTVSFLEIFKDRETSLSFQVHKLLNFA